MNINELARELHANAVAHGWWDEEPDDATHLALIHSEWSEAGQEARAGRPLVYRMCSDCKLGPCGVEPKQDPQRIGGSAEGATSGCRFRSEAQETGPRSCDAAESRGAADKPEGIAVELIDGVIRILDWFAHDGVRIQANQGTDRTEDFESLADLGAEAGLLIPPDAPTLITCLHSLTSQAWQEDDRFALVTAASMALNWIRMQGIDPLEVLLAKHEYNKTRKYRHGKRF